VLSSRASRCFGPARLAGEAGQLRGGRFCSGAPLHRLRHRQGFIGDHRLQRDARALLGGGDGGVISFSKRSQHHRWPASPVPVALGRFTTTLRIHLGCCQPRCLNVCLPIPASLTDRDSHSLRLSGWPSGHLLRCSLNGVLPQGSGNPSLTGLNPRALDPQTSAAWPRTSPAVQFSLKIRILELGAFRRTKVNGGRNGGETHS
jgi:hypothetical protein